MLLRCSFPRPAKPAVLRVIAGLLCLGALPLHAAPPAMDDFVNRGVLDTGVAETTSNAAATLESGEPLPAGYAAPSYSGSLWYEWTPQAFGWHEIHTDGSAADTILSVWTSSNPFNPTLGSLSLLHVNNEAGPSDHTSRVRFLAEDSKTYYIAIASPSTATRGAIAIEAVSLPDPFSKLTAFSLSPGTANVTTSSVAVTATFTLQSTAEIAAGEFRLYDPHNTLHTTMPVSGASRISGTIPNGTYSVGFTLPRYLEPGTWRWSLSLRNAVTITALTKFASYGWEAMSPSLMATAGLTVQNTGSIDTYQVWTSQQSVAASTATQTSSYAGDGVANLAKFAFGVPLTQHSPSSLAITGSGGSAVLAQTGMPVIQRNGQSLSITFVRRKNAASEGLTYQVQFSDDLVNWTPSVLSPTLIASNADYEAVTVPDVTPTGPQPQRFVHIVVDFHLP